MLSSQIARHEALNYFPAVLKKIKQRPVPRPVSAVLSHCKVQMLCFFFLLSEPSNHSMDLAVTPGHNEPVISHL